MATAQTVITNAMLELGVIAADETPSSTDLAFGLAKVNRILDNWAAERLMVYTIQPATFALTAGKQSYTLGIATPAADFNVARPAKIERAVLQVSSGALEIPLHLYSDQEWAGIQLKTIGNAYPAGVWDDGGFPLRTLYFWPIPAGAESVGLYMWQPVSQLAALSTAFAAPPGYEDALTLSLAEAMISAFPSAPGAAKVMNDALIARARVKSMNSASNVPLMTCEVAGKDRGSGWVDNAAFLRGF